MKKQKSSSVSTLNVEKPQSELKDPSKSDDKLGEVLEINCIASLPRKKWGIGNWKKNGMVGLHSADTALKLAAQGLLWVLKLKMNSDCAAKIGIQFGDTHLPRRLR